MTTEQIEQWRQSFIDRFGFIDDKTFNWFLSKAKVIEEEARKEQEEIMYQAFDNLEKNLTCNVGMLRQWLNEERIKDASRFVTNKELDTWLFNGALFTTQERKEDK